MNTLSRALALAALCAVTAGPGWAGVTVTFTNPEKYADMPFDQSDRQRVLKELTDHFTRLAARLPAGQDLKVDILDIDLAGREIPFRRYGSDVRVMKGGADWPHIHLRYTIEANGQVLQSGDDHLDNMMYLERLNRYSSGDSLRYEKQMIDDWYKSKIGTKHLG